jgi:uncharacterized protein YjbI with pentapeptide repeats
MANPEHLKLLNNGKGSGVWNRWREKNPEIRPDLIEASLLGTDLRWAKLEMAKLASADLSWAKLQMANMNQADLREAKLHDANMSGANLTEAKLRKADLRGANLRGANLSGAKLHDADLRAADLREANLSNAEFIGANLLTANLERANLSQANFTAANLKEANLKNATLVETNLEMANLSTCSIYGISAWGLKLEGTIQSNLIITPDDATTITLDNLEVAQFIYLLLNNQKIRGVIDTIARKVVLILGRFTPERKAVLDGIREELRKRDYLPVLFDFDKPATRAITETIRTLAHLSRFIIADISDPSSIPLELQAVVPDLAVPVQQLLVCGEREFGMFVDLRKKYHWVLATHQYTDIADLLASLGDKVIAPAEVKAKELEKR